MKNKKRISLILVFAMVLQLFGASFVFAQDAATNTPVATEEYKFMKALNMLDPSATLYEGKAITRGQFSYIAARLLGYDGKNEVVVNPHFSDLAGTASYAGAVEYLHEMGIISGIGNGEFKPEEPIIFNDATAILVKILGYEKIAAVKYGAYPIGYIRMADSLDIYLDMAMPQGKDPITTEQALVMFYNATFAPVPEMSAYGEEASSYEYDSKNTILYVYHDIVRDEGIVKDDSVASLSGTTSLKNGGAIIGNTKLSPSTNGFRATGLLGAYVDFYYVEGTKELVYAMVNVDSTNTLTINYDDLVINSADFTLTNIVYYENEDKIKDARIAMNADVIYNGGLFNSYTVEDLKIDSGFITLIDRNEDKIYDVVNVTEYKDYIISSFNKNDEVLYTKNAPIYLDKYDVVSVTDKSGADVGYEGIVNGNLVSIAAAKDYTCINIVCCGAPTSGVVTKAQTDENIYYMGEAGYELSKDFVANAKETDYPKLGDGYDFYINADGKVAEIILRDSTDWYKGYLIGIGPESAGGLETTAIAGIVNKNEEFIQYYLGQKVTLNGSRVNAADVSTHPAVYKDGMPIRQPVKYKLDEWGELMEIETPVDIIGDPNYPNEFDLERFSKDKEFKGTVKFKGDSRINAINGSYFLSADSLVVHDPYLGDASKAFKYDEIEVLPLTEFTKMSQFSDCILYDIDDKNSVGYFTFKGTDASSSGAFDFDANTRKFFVVESVFRAIATDKNGDNEKVKAVKGYVQGKEVTYYEHSEKTKKSFDNLRPGDVLTLMVDGNYITNYVNFGNISNIDKDGKEVGPLGSQLLFSENGSEYADVVCSVYVGPLYSNGSNGSVIVGWDENKYLGTSYNGSPGITITSYDRNTGKMSAIKASEIYTNLVPDSNIAPEVDDSTPRLMIYRRWGYACDIIFIK